jgi:hypothetical protein
MFARTLLLLLTLTPTLTLASSFEAASDFTLPFRLNIEGAGNSGRENTTLGFEFRHNASDLLQWGMRLQFDVEQNNGAFRKWGLAPFLTEHWMRQETLHPYARMELPYIWKGAPNNQGNDSTMDLGIGLGVGVAWKKENFPLSVNYDFGFHYYFGITDALSELTIDLFRIGVSYLF